MKKLGIAIIGTGNIAHAHLDGYLKDDRCEVRALCDIYPEKCGRLCDDLGLQDRSRITVTTDYVKLLGRDDIDLVSVCLPPSLHEEVSSAFLLAGKHVLCEKPMAASLEEADKMLDAEKKSGRILAIVSQNRFRQDAWNVKRMMDQGVFGKTYLTRAYSMWYRGTNYYDLWWRGTWDKEGGGCTLNHSVHQIDMLNWFCGLPLTATSVFANLAHPNSEVEDASLTLVTYPHSLGEISVSLNDMNERQGFLFQCEKASVTIPWSVKCVRQLPNGFPEEDEEAERRFQKLYDSYPKLRKEGHPAEISNVIDAITGKDRLVVNGEDGKQALELIYAVYRSATTKGTVLLPLTQNDPFYTKDGMLRAVPRFYRKTKSVANLEGAITLGNMGGK
ncbi:MAG: Gfo/Idh/MocA family oxidoreductase [Sphaerochaetaceae bacterium]